MHVYRNKCTYHKGLLNQLYYSTEMKCLGYEGGCGTPMANFYEH